ncbi:MAG: hypothetical protein ABIO45_11730 [Burkholderiaceae bacterium]
MNSTLHSLVPVRLALAGALFLALGGQPALADGAKTSTVDLKIGVAITETLGPGDSAECPYIGQISGSGYSTELGAVEIAAIDCVVPTDASFTSFAFFTRPGTFVTVTTRSGGQLFGSYAGTATGAPAPIESISAKLTISGGNGRYRKASGTATIEGVENVGTMPAVGVLVISGKLSY